MTDEDRAQTLMEELVRPMRLWETESRSPKMSGAHPRYDAILAVVLTFVREVRVDEAKECGVLVEHVDQNAFDKIEARITELAGSGKVTGGDL